MPFSHKDYKKFIQSRIAESSQRGIVSHLAKAAGCQRSYLSKVLHEHIHLLPDHLYGIAQFLKLTTEETDYLLLLLERDRSGSKAYQVRIESRMAAIRKKREDIAHLLKKPKSAPSFPESIYYSGWHWSAIHILVSIPKFQKVDAISQKLQLDPEQVMKTLTKLEEYGLVRRVSDKWEFASNELHIPKESPLVSLHHNNWRARAVIDSTNPETKGMHFTAVQSMNEECYEKIKTLLMRFIEESSTLAGPSKPERLVSISFDLFEV